jgi:alkanesulfonate monooxygenase SsuD/methylene tetrahydromethanopterin reductase-like flavin-dependent oxidoreductase (luciferase family)
MESGVDSFGAVISDRATAITVSPVQRMENLLAEAMLADPVGPDVFGIVEQHRSEFVDSAPAIILGAAATRTKNIRLTSAVTVSAADLFSCEILKVVPGRLLPKLSPQ